MSHHMQQVLGLKADRSGSCGAQLGGIQRNRLAQHREYSAEEHENRSGALQSQPPQRRGFGSIGGIALPEPEQLAPELSFQRLAQVTGIHLDSLKRIGPT